MRTTLVLGLLALATTTASAEENSPISLQPTNTESVVTFEKAEVELANAQGKLATKSVVYYGPQVWVNGRLKKFFVNATNGDQFCEDRGHSREVNGSTITCGEDESSYGNYNWSGRYWTYQSTGSANKCYPLYATIKCQ